MATLKDLLSLLRRPIRTDAGSSDPQSSGVTEGELLAALAAISTDRAAAQATLATAADRRESMLLEVDDDAGIEEIGREVDRASLKLERLERIEPELLIRLAKLRDQARIDLWAKLRNRYIAVGREHVRLLQSIEFDAAAYNEAFTVITQRFPDAAAILPRFYFPRTDAAQELADALDRLTCIGYNPHPPRKQPLAQSVAQLVEEGRGERAASAFGVPFSELGDSQVCLIRLRVPRQLNGEWHPAQSVLQVPHVIAEAEITSGKAVLVDNEQKASS